MGKVRQITVGRFVAQVNPPESLNHRRPIWIGFMDPVKKHDIAGHSIPKAEARRLGDWLLKATEEK